MAANESWSGIDWNSAMDADLDKIRDSYHFVLMIAAHGSLVVPGWDTVVVGSDKSQPDTIKLIKGTREIHFKYTWSDNAVASIQMCYDDGVSSPGLVCKPAVSIGYDENGNLTNFGTVSGFAQVSLTLAESDLTKTANATGVTDITQCVPFLTHTTANGVSYAGYATELELTVDLWDDAGTPKVTVARAGYNGAVGATEDVVVTLIEFPSSVEVNKYTWTGSDPTSDGNQNYVDRTITEVNTSAAFIVLTAQGSGVEIGHAGCHCPYITSSTNVRVYGGTASTYNQGDQIAYVVSDPSGNVFTTRRGYAQSSSDYTFDIPLTSFDQSKSIVIGNVYASQYLGTYPNSTNAQKSMFYCAPTSSTNVRIQRQVTYANQVMTAAAQVIEFFAGISVQHAAPVFPASTDTKDTTITAVDLTSSFVIGTMGTDSMNARLNDGASGGNGAPGGQFAAGFELTSTTNVRATVDVTSAAERQTAFQVVTLG